jgi:hypothetical protein
MFGGILAGLRAAVWQNCWWVSKSRRVGELMEHPDYCRLAQYGRKEIIYLIDILVQQGFLELDGHGHLIPVSATSAGAGTEKEPGPG